MQQFLFLFQHSTSHASGNWAWLGIATGEGNAEQLQEMLAKQADNTQVVLLIPSEEVILTSADIPAKQASQIQAAAPFVIEEQLACDPSKLQVSSKRFQNTDKLVQIAAVSRTYLQQCLQRLAALEIIPEQAYADSMSLPVPATDEILIHPQSSERLLLRWGKNQGTAIATELLETWLPMLLSENPGITKIQLDSSTATVQSLESRLNKATALEVINAQLSINSAEGYAQAVNLLSGDFRPARGSLNASDWRWPLRLLAASLVLVVASALVSYSNDKRQLQQLDSNIETIFRATFPKVQRIEDPLIQARQQISMLAAGNSDRSSLIALLQEFTPAVKQYPNVILKALDYRNGKLEIRLQAGNIEMLENLRDAIKQQGISASLSSASLAKEGVDARLLLSVAGQP